MSSTAPISRPGTKHAGFNVFGLTELLDHKPRHLARRADVAPDSAPTSRCTYRAMRDCGDWKCPKHRPVSYTDSMARHAADSFGLDHLPRTSPANGCGHVEPDSEVYYYGADGNTCPDCWF